MEIIKFHTPAPSPWHEAAGYRPVENDFGWDFSPPNPPWEKGLLLPPLSTTRAEVG
jgi:hypothetical protein